MKIEDIKKYIPEITSEQLKENIDVEVISCYGGMTCMVIKLDEVESFVERQDRVFGLDYIFYI